ncbi:sodium-dependent multivitamin transporter-like [Ptychodera flava]|uniref:sodium-dependent multivitamin transporter-like n=1 Tax=Ptychodera flava TaxID=63121 RepID=UPI00396A629B
MAASANNDIILFGAFDWVLFAVMLAVSAATGVYHAVAKGGQKTTSQYLVANRSMGCFPIATSYFVSYLSAVAVLGFPAEIYVHGIQFSLGLIGTVVGGCIMAWTFIPVIRELNIISIYEYMSLRFHFILRITTALLFITLITLYMGTVMIGPAIAFQVQGIDYWVTIIITGIVCTFYTTLGGMAAVIWADVFQCFVMIVCVVVVLILGTLEAGGMSAVWEYNHKHGKLNFFEFDPDPTLRLSFWSIVIGQTVYSMQNVVQQGSVQRLLSAKSLRQAQGTLLLTIPYMIVMFWILFLIGLVLFAYYDNGMMALAPAINATFSPDLELELGKQAGHNYEPKYARPDQILVYFVSAKLGHIPGLQGLFVSCLFAGALSSISSGLNALIAVVLRDVLIPWRQWRANTHGGVHDENDRRDILISKILSVVFGLISTGLGFGIPYLGTFVVITNTMISVTNGPVFGAFTLGMAYPRANTIGTFIGTIVSTAIGLWIGIGAVLAREGSIAPLTIYKLSFAWYVVLTWLITITVGIVVSEIARCVRPSLRQQKVDPKLLLTFLRPKERLHSSLPKYEIGEDDLLLRHQKAVNTGGSDRQHHDAKCDDIALRKVTRFTE